MKNIAIFGAGGFGREVAMLINQINKIDIKWNFIGFFDDGIAQSTTINDSLVIGGIDELNNYENDLEIVFAIGVPNTKEKIFNSLKNPRITYPTLIHPNVQIGEYNKIGDGCIITAGNIITVNTRIGNHVILNLGCTVGHDTVIDDFCSFMPSVNISGEVNISKNVYVGTGAKIINLVDIGENSIIGAGAVVSKSLPANCTAVGVPAKVVKIHS